MRAQARSGTAPELTVRKALHALGVRYTCDNADLPGTPDLANRRRRWAIFVHGCFWHQHPACRRATIPRANADFWTEKFAGNRARDWRVGEELRQRGFHVGVVWECETREPERLHAVLRSFTLQSLGAP